MVILDTMARRKKKQQQVKREGKAQRNPYALIAKWRSGAGRHEDQRKEQSRHACRGRVAPDDA